MPNPRSSGLRRLGALLQKVAEPIYWLDARRRLVHANVAFEEFVGRPLHELIGLTCPPDADDDRLGPEQRALAELLAPAAEALQGRDAGGPLNWIRADGERREYRLEVHVLRDGHGRILGYLAWLQPAQAAGRFPESAIQSLRAELVAARDQARLRFGIDSLVGYGPVHDRLLQQIRAAAAARASVVVIGEAGSGRCAVARTIAGLGEGDRLVGIHDCASTSADLLEKAIVASLGDQNEHATLVLLDVDRLDSHVQAVLVPRVEAGLRILGTSRYAIEEAVRAGSMRYDFACAVSTMTIPLLPLRERLEELPLLSQQFLEIANRRGGESRLGFEPEALEILGRYDWPGNLAELERVVNAAHRVSRAEVIRGQDLPAAIQGHHASAYLPPKPPPRPPLDGILAQVERDLLEQAIAQGKGNKSRAADILGISRPRLYRRMQELGLVDAVDAMPEAASDAEFTDEPPAPEAVTEGD